MLDAMRKHSQSFLIYVLFGAIIAVFAINFGPGGQSCSSEFSYAARVNGETIAEQEFQRSYGEQHRYFQQVKPKQVLDQLIDLRLLKQAAVASGLTVSDAELREFILKAPAFQVNGSFDNATYQRYVEYAVGTNAARFEDDLRSKLLAQKYREAIEATVTVSDDEVLQDYLADNDKVDLYVVSFKESELTDIAAPTAAEIEAFKKDHHKEIEDRFTRDKLRYDEPRKYRARHILIKVGEKAPQDEVDKVKAKIQAIEKELAAGADFSELARKNSEDSSKDKGGELGWFGPGTMVKPFEEAVAKLKPGELSGPVRTPFGFHLIKLDEVKEPIKRELATVEGDIAKELIVEQRKKDANRRRADQFMAALKGGKSIAQIAEPQPEGEPDDGKEKKKIPTRAQKSGEKVHYVTTGLFNKQSMAVPKVGFVPDLVKDAFALSADKKLAPKVYASGDRLFVVELKERDVADAAKFKEQRDTLRSAALGRKRYEIVAEYLKRRRAEAKIDVNLRLVGNEGA